MPQGFEMTSDKFKDVADKTWSLKPPNLVVQCDAGMLHPSQLCTPAVA